MLEFLIAAGLGALVAHSKNQTYEGKMELLQRDFKGGKLTPEQAQSRYKNIVDAEIEKIPDDGIPLPPHIKKALEDGLDYRTLADKVDPNTYNFVEAAYWYGDWNRPKVK